jgi:hypothetical protein
MNIELIVSFTIR